MGTPAFPHLGKHCSFTDCNLLDFLPFTCDVCNQVFCLDHRSYSRHGCLDAKDRDVTVLVCPLCAKAVRLVSNEDPNLTFDNHVRTNCDPSNYEKVHKKPRCPVRGCRETLTFSNRLTCKDCKQEVCLKHRFGPDHNCKGPVKTAKESSWYGGQLVQSFKQGLTVGGGQNRVNPGQNSMGSMLRASAEAGVSKLSNFTANIFSAVGSASQGQSAGPSQKSKPAANSSMKELCPQCGAQFLNVSMLIQHVESAHSTNKPLAVKDIVDLCPKCGKGFRDPISLVNHVETDHGGTSSRRR